MRYLVIEFSNFGRVGNKPLVLDLEKDKINLSTKKATLRHNRKAAMEGPSYAGPHTYSYIEDGKLYVWNYDRDTDVFFHSNTRDYNILKQSDTLEDLIDAYTLTQENGHKVVRDTLAEIKDLRSNEESVYGCIWYNNTLIPISRLTLDGEVEKMELKQD